MVKLTSLQAENRTRCISFADQYVNQGIKKRDKDCEFDKSLWKQCSDLNTHGIFISKEYGGLGYSMNDGMSMLESIGFSFRDNGLSFAIVAQLTSCSLTINNSGSESQKSKYLEGIIKGDSVFAHAITERTSGSDAFDMESVFSFDENSKQIEIKGYKTYCSNLPVADFVLCYVNHDKEDKSQILPSAFIIPRALIPEIEVIEKMGLNTCIMGRADLDLKVSTDQILGIEGKGLAMFQEAITYERIGMSACHLGTIERILFEAIAWTGSRVVGGQALGSKQAITHSLVNIYNEWITLRAFLYHITSLKLSFSKLYLQASILNDKVSELYVHACTKILQVYGGLGYTKDHEIERMLRDAMASKIYSGTSEIQKEIIWNMIKR